MRVEELEAVCHAASFASSLRRAMAQNSPVCSVSASTDSNASSQSFIHTDAHDTRHADAATSSYQHATYGSEFDTHETEQPEHFRSGFSPKNHGQNGAGVGSDDTFRRQDSDALSQCSSSETEIGGLKQKRQEWEAEREELLREMGNLR